MRKSAISRTIIVVVVVVILIVAAAGAVALSVSQKSTSSTTSTTSQASSQSSSTVPISSSSSTISSTSSSTTTSAAAANQNMTIEALVAPGGIGLYPLTTNTWPSNLAYDPIFNYNETGTSSVPIPWLATGYSADPTGQYWTFTLRQGVTYSDGTQFNATSLKDDIDNDIISNVQNTPYITLIRGGSAYVASNHNAANQSTFIHNDGLTVVSQYVLNLNLTHPEADLLSDFTGTLAIYWDVSPSAIIANGGMVNGVGNTWLITHSAGTGPYILQNYNTATGTLVFIKNPHWWATAALGITQPFTQITINVVLNSATQELDVRSGVANVIALPVANVYDFADKTTWLTKGQLVSDVSGTNVFGPYLASQFYMLEFNQNYFTPAGVNSTVQPMRNAHLVQGIDEAWNASAFIQNSLNGFGVVNGGVMLQGQLGYQSYPPPFGYNLTASKANLVAACAQLGCSPSNPLQLTFIATNDQTAELAGSLLVSTINSMQAGVILNFQPLASSAKISTFLSREFDISLYEMPNEPPDPLTILEQFGTPLSTQGGPLGYNYPAITALYTQAAQTSNVTQRAAIYTQMDKAIAQTGYWEKVAQFDNVFVTSSHIQIANFNPDLLNFLPPIEAFSYH